LNNVWIVAKKSSTKYCLVVLNEGNQDAHKMEALIFKQLMKLGFILMQLFFAIQNKGNYGKIIETA
jgi:hypothetical protein